MSRVHRVHNQKRYKELRRDLRNNPTSVEALLWNSLMNRQLEGRKFRRQHSVSPYILDFYCPAEKLAVELDGSSHDNPIRHHYDEEREQYLNMHGITILRFANGEVTRNVDCVLQAIAAALGEKNQPPHTPPV